MLEIASTDDRTTGDPYVNKYVDKMKRWVREAKKDVRNNTFFTDLEVMECVDDENANKCGLDITLPVC
jgi:hypothetical protein